MPATRHRHPTRGSCRARSTTRCPTSSRSQPRRPTSSARFVRRTALRRTPRDRLLRNVAVALGNSGDPRAVPALVQLAAHREPLVRVHAVWALGVLGVCADLSRETDPDVLAEASYFSLPR